MTNPIKNTGFKLDLGSAGRSFSSPKAEADTTPKKVDNAGSAAIGVAASVKSQHIDPVSVPRNKIPTSNGPPSILRLFSEAPTKIRQEIEGEKILTAIMSGPAVTNKIASAEKRASSSQLEQLILYVQEENKEDFKASIKNLPQEQAPEIIKKLLAELAFDEKGKEYQFIMSNLREVFPQIETYVAHVEIPGFEGDALSTEGIRSMVKILTEKQSLKMPCIVCDTYEQFEEQLKKIAESPSDARIGLIVRNQNSADKKTINLHVTPVYVEKKGSSFRYSITDSLGSHQLYTNVIAAKINKQLANISQDVQIYCYYDNSRQGKSDKTNCPIFCLRDLVFLSKFRDPIGLLDRSSQQYPKDSQSKVSNIHYFSKLPPAMMKLTQSLSRIEGYDGGKLRESMKAKHERNGLNVMIEQRFLKYQRLLVAQVVSQAITKS